MPYLFIRLLTVILQLKSWTKTRTSKVRRNRFTPASDKAITKIDVSAIPPTRSITSSKCDHVGFRLFAWMTFEIVINCDKTTFARLASPSGCKQLEGRCYHWETYVLSLRLHHLASHHLVHVFHSQRHTHRIDFQILKINSPSDGELSLPLDYGSARWNAGEEKVRRYMWIAGGPVSWLATNVH